MSDSHYAKSGPTGQADGGRDRRRTIVLAILAIIVIAVAVFVGLKLATSDSSQSSTEAPTTQQTTAEPSVTDSPSEDQDSPDTRPATPRPTSMTEGEGETSSAPTGLPDEAEEITTVIVNEGFATAAFRTPSGNIGCDINTDIEGGSHLM